MAWLRFFSRTLKSENPILLRSFPQISLNPNPIFRSLPFSSSFLITKIPGKFKKKVKKPEDSPRTKPVQPESTRIPHFESLVKRDDHFRFLTRSKDFISKQPDRILLLDDANKLYRELGFLRGRKVTRFILQHPLIFKTTYRDGKMWLGFSELMKDLLDEERALMDDSFIELDRVNRLRKLLMMTKDKRILLSKIHHTRSLFGFPEDFFTDRIGKYPDYFRVVNGNVLELMNWDQSLAVSELERQFMVDEDKAKRVFKFPMKHNKELDLDEDDTRKLNLLNTLPLVSPYSSDGWKLDVWTLEAEKYRVGILHEFLNLTLEKRASIHHIVEFKDEFSLTKQTYHMLKKQYTTFYLAGTEMNWSVFLKDGYNENGFLINKDPQVVFNEKLYKYADMDSM